MRKIFLLSFAVLLVSTSLLYFLNRDDNLQLLTINSDPPGLSMSLSRISGEHDEGSAVKIVSGKPIKIKRGNYLLATKATGDYRQLIQDIVVGESALNIDVAPAFTDAKLSSLLGSEQAAVTKAMETTYAEHLQILQIRSGKLHERGEWYSGLLVPKTPGEFDIYRFVLKRVNSQWKLQTLPPELIISRQDYPQIPVDILRDLNRRAP
jgi:hypothetical protein